MARAGVACLAFVAAVLFGCSHGREIMSTPTHFISADEIRRIAGSTSAAVLPDEDADTFPIPVRVGGGVVILVMYYKETGRPGQRVVHPPHYAMHLDGETGKVLRFWAVTPDELGIRTPLTPVPGAGTDPAMAVDERIRRRDRFLALSPDLWKAFAAGSKQVDGAVAAAAREYLDIFLTITKKEVAPFYVGASPAWFEWLRSVAAPQGREP